VSEGEYPRNPGRLIEDAPRQRKIPPVAEPMSRRERAAAFLTSPSVHWLARLVPMRPGLVVLNYHRIAPDAEPPLDRGLWSASPEGFAAQLSLLQRHFDVISVAELEATLAAPRGRHVLITFDDGYRDNYEYALPALRAAGLPATFFLSTGFLDRPKLAWWDEIAWMLRAAGGAEVEAAIVTETDAYKRLPAAEGEGFLDRLAERTGSGRAPASLVADTWMTWEMAREIRDAGMGIGGHTVDHPILARLDRAGQEAEIEGCRSRLAAEMGLEMTLFSYPVGLPDCFDATTRTLLRERGVRYSFSNYGGFVAAGESDPLDLRRTNVGRRTSIALYQSLVEWPRTFAKW
jgi:peptidoglycan/xylan/chitin deacetylase (PgdA/CDA1 family)